MPAIPADASPEQAKAIRASDKIRAILEHYKQPDPVGMPGVPIPDPMPIPDMKQNYAVGTTMNFKKTTVHGLSQFRIVSVHSHLDNMQVTQKQTSHFFFKIKNLTPAHYRRIAKFFYKIMF